MDCTEVRERSSALLEDALTAVERDACDAHLASCAACRAEAASLAAAVGALRTLSPGPTDPRYATSVAAAVYAAVGSAAVPRRSPRRVSAGRVLSHAAACLFGVGLAWAAARVGAEDVTPVAQLEPRIVEVEVPVEVVREIPVEVVREVVREVPVEVVRDVVREVPVEVVREVVVERIEYVDRPVVNPLQADLDRDGRTAEHHARAFSDALRIARLAQERAQTARIEGSANDARRTVAASERPGARTRSPRGSAPVAVSREGGHVTIRTRGEASEVFPALISTLTDPDPAVVAAAEQLLNSMRRELADRAGIELESPLLGGAVERGFEAADEDPGGLRGLLASRREDRRDSASGESAHALWQQWWADNSLAALQP